MLDQKKHKQILIKIIKTIYADPLLRKNLGFKGGTAAMMFYDLPRMSVDLDFDLLDQKKEKQIFTKLNKILPKFGELKDARIKFYTIFFLINYQTGLQNLKIEISRRDVVTQFQTQDFLGVPVLVTHKNDMVANKLAAIIGRNRPVSRDFFDVWYFLNQHCEINLSVLKIKTGKTLKQVLDQTIKLVTAQEKNFFLQGLGELLSEKQKSWVRDHLQKELLFELRLAREVL